MVKFILFLMLVPSIVSAAANDFRISDNSGNVLNINSDGTMPVSISGGGVISSLTTGYVPKAASSTSLDDSAIFQSGSNIGVSTITPNALLDVSSTANQDLVRVNDNGTGDASPFIISSDGNVGIGSATPGTKLDVQGTIRGTGYSFGATAMTTPTGTGAIVLATTPTLVTPVIGAATGTSLALSGNIGIGGGGLANPLTVDSNSTAFSMILDNANARGPGLRFEEGGTELFYVSTYGHIAGNTDNNMAIWTNFSGGDIIFSISDSATEAFRMDSGGGFSIGAGTPVSKLDVEGSASIGATYAGTTAAPTNGMIVEGNVGIGSSAPGAQLNVLNVNAGPSFVVHDVAGDTSPFIIATDGNVAIGTTNTSRKLIVNLGGNADENWILRSLTEDASITGVRMQSRNQDGTAINEFRIDGNPLVLAANAANNVGIGTTVPSSKLALDGTTGAGQVTLDGDLGGCLMFRDTDNAGWTECDALDGTLSCSVDADGQCD